MIDSWCTKIRNMVAPEALEQLSCGTRAVFISLTGKHRKIPVCREGPIFFLLSINPY